MTDPFAGLRDIASAAQVLHVSRSTLYRMINDGHLAAIHHGGRSWIEDAEIQDYLSRIRATATRTRTERLRRTRSRT